GGGASLCRLHQGEAVLGVTHWREFITLRVEPPFSTLGIDDHRGAVEIPDHRASPAAARVPRAATRRPHRRARPPIPACHAPLPCEVRKETIPRHEPAVPNGAAPRVGGAS